MPESPLPRPQWKRGRARGDSSRPIRNNNWGNNSKPHQSHTPPTFPAQPPPLPLRDAHPGPYGTPGHFAQAPRGYTHCCQLLNHFYLSRPLGLCALHFGRSTTDQPFALLDFCNTRSLHSLPPAFPNLTSPDRKWLLSSQFCQPTPILSSCSLTVAHPFHPQSLIVSGLIPTGSGCRSPDSRPHWVGSVAAPDVCLRRDFYSRPLHT